MATGVQKYKLPHIDIGVVFTVTDIFRFPVSTSASVRKRGYGALALLPVQRVGSPEVQ